MAKSFLSLAVIGAVTLLSACGGGGGGGGGNASLESYAADLAAIGSDPTLASRAPDMTINGLNGSATYNGVINIGTDAVSNPAGAAAYYGSLSMTVDFSNAGTDDAVTGSAGNFVQFFSEIASPKTGQAVPGSIAMTGNLTGNNEAGIGDGMTGTAAGTIDGIDVAYTFDGNITGLAGNGLSLVFDGDNADSTGGVGLAVD